MPYETALIAQKLRRWEKYLNEFRLPQWQEIPDLGLYMEQVIVLLKQYLDYLPPELKGDQVITAAAINNYVRNRVMPEPRKKRYYRLHIAYLILICTLKQSLSLAMLQRLIPREATEEEIRALYESYVERHRLSAQYFVEQVKRAAGQLLGHEDVSPHAAQDTLDLVTMAALVGGFSLLLAEKLLLLEGKTLAEGEQAAQ